MQVLPRVVRLAAALAALVALAGCSQFDAALGQRQAIVSFRAGTTVAERLAIRSACANAPAAVPAALPDLKKYPYALQQVTYTITKASNAQVATLQKCLDKFPAVVGVNLQNAGDEGG